MPGNFAADRGPSAVSSSARAGATASLSTWWRSLKDPDLNSLVERAIAGNPDIEIALDRLQIARTEELIVIGGGLPVVNASAGGGRGTGRDLSRGRAATTLVSADNTSNLTPGLKQITHVVGFDAEWEIDLFGRYRRAREAAAAGVEVAAAERNAVLTAVIANVVRAYVDMRALEEQLRILRQNLDVARKYVKLTKEQSSRGITNDLELTLAERQLATLQARESPLIAQIQAARAVIAVLVGSFPEDLSRIGMSGRPLPTLPSHIRDEIPLELLQRRPDIIAAERELARATALVGVATANLFPRVALTGAAGFQGQGFGVSPTVGSNIWALGPSISWAVLDFGVLDAQVDVADLETKLLLSNYKNTVLNAVREVDVALASYSAQLVAVRNLNVALVSSKKAVLLATERYNRGLTDSLNVIDAQRVEYDLERQYVEARQFAADQLVAIYKALGGGWENYQEIPAIHRPQPAVIAAVTRSLAERHSDGSGTDGSSH